MPVVKFSNHEVIPPRGGWSFPIQGRPVTAHSEGQLIEELLKVGLANGQPITRANAELELWRYFCSREPERCKRGKALDGGENDPAVLVPEVWGPWIWQFLNLAAARFHKLFFFNLLDHIPVLMTCEKCRAHWREVIRDRPPSGIVDAKTACRWVNAIHNDVNARTGKQPYPYQSMVAEYGAPP